MPVLAIVDVQATCTLQECSMRSSWALWVGTRHRDRCTQVQVETIPTLVILERTTCRVITRAGRDAVDADPAGASSATAHACSTSCLTSSNCITLLLQAALCLKQGVTLSRAGCAGDKFPWVPPSLLELARGDVVDARGKRSDFASVVDGHKVFGLYFSAQCVLGKVVRPVLVLTLSCLMWAASDALPALYLASEAHSPHRIHCKQHMHLTTTLCCI